MDPSGPYSADSSDRFFSLEMTRDCFFRESPPSSRAACCIAHHDCMLQPPSIRLGGCSEQPGESLSPGRCSAHHGTRLPPADVAAGCNMSQEVTLGSPLLQSQTGNSCQVHKLPENQALGDCHDVHDIELRSLEGKLELLTLQRQISAAKCEAFLAELVSSQAAAANRPRPRSRHHRRSLDSHPPCEAFLEELESRSVWGAPAPSEGCKASVPSRLHRRSLDSPLSGSFVSSSKRVFRTARSEPRSSRSRTHRSEEAVAFDPREDIWDQEAALYFARTASSRR